jgi:lipase maturation factor 1
MFARWHGPRRTELVSALFVRGLGVVFGVAFASLLVQVVGLIGARGVLPAVELVDGVRERLGAAGVLRLPCWFWWTGASDSILSVACAIGMVCSLAVASGRWARVGLFGAWSLYLSFCSVGGAFFSYQWDMLLLECGLVGLFVATPGSPIGLWLARVLCFKLMWLSGLVKLTSGDPTWRDLSALSFHWWTQPLPAWPAVLLSQLPRAAQSAMTFSALAIELVAPFAIFGPRPARLGAAAALAALQVMIAATGSYGFFNLLSLLLCAALLDDDALLRSCPERMRGALAQLRRAPGCEPRFARVRRRAQLALASLLLAASIGVAVDAIVPLPAALGNTLDLLAPLRSVNRYGLFAVMTTERREIALEGSLDGVDWRRYEFPWKPDALDRRPRFATPHMPRLDWQMWFAALGRCAQQRWLLRFMERVLEGSPDVLGLLARDPFPDGPPRYLRTPQAQYRFAPGAAWLRGQWWVREPIEPYCPPVALREGRLVPAPGLPAR